ncbi:MAG: flagellar biosynthetic protein FliR [Rhodocyclaceae bacterium]|nr:flagellar biosynthetic protein FliR [Rhodocyclaceae bacterium]
MGALSAAQIDLLVTLYGLPLVRILGLLAADPLLGSARVPIRIRIAAALLLTVVLVPTLPPPPAVALSGPAGWGLVIQQFLIGVTIGFVVRLVFTALEVAGELIGLQMGLGFATFIDPAHNNPVPVVTAFLTTLGFLFFLALDGHHLVITALAQSFHVLPPGRWPDGQLFMGVVQTAADVFSSGLRIALPLVIVLLFTNLALGVMTRASPQINLFAVGFALTLVVGGVMLAVQMTAIDGPLMRLFELLHTRLDQLVGEGMR